MRPDGSAIVPSVAQRSHARHQPLLGGLLVKEGLINQVQLERMLALQSDIQPRPLLGQLLVDHKLVTPHELNTALTKYNREYLLGDVLIETNVITATQLEAALALQRKTNAALGEILIELGFITERQLKHALSIQLRIGFVDLDDCVMDPELTTLITESYARRHQLIPIGRTGDRLVLAMADPTDVELIAELRSCIGCEIAVVTATSDALQRAFTRTYGARETLPRPVTRAETDETPGPTPVIARPARPTPGPADIASVDRPRTRNGPTRPSAALAAIRARMEPIRQIARTWERWAGSVEGLLGELRERRSEITRLADELRESQAAHARTSSELEAKADALAKLEAAYAALAGERESLQGALDELRERHDALLHDCRFAIDRLETALQRLKA